eukprot:GHVR01104752.1.p1 GENE.GHVR01104752.1~~GHVR01104752.1.p1  ORF type:complete len:284 (+),score=11.72 GHVR01104752.1:366-1217(+)
MAAMKIILTLCVLLNLSLNLSHGSRPGVYRNKDANVEIATEVKKTVFAKNEFIILRQMLGMCVSILDRLSVDNQVYMIHTRLVISMASCFYKVTADNHIANLTINIRNSSYHKVKSTMAYLSLKGQPYNIYLSTIKMQLPSAYRVEVTVKYFQLPYSTTCLPSWMAYQDSNKNKFDVDNLYTKHSMLCWPHGSECKDYNAVECSHHNCLNKYFSGSGTMYGKYCGTLKPWTFHSAGNFINMVIRLLKAGKVNLVYQPFSLINSSANAANIFSSIYIYPDACFT